MEEILDRKICGCGRRMPSRHSGFHAIASAEAPRGRDRKNSMRSWLNACVGSRSRSKSRSRPDSAVHGHDDGTPSVGGNVAAYQVYCFRAGGDSASGCKEDPAARGSSRSLSAESGEIRIGTSCEDRPLLVQGRGTNYVPRAAAYRWSRRFTTVGVLTAVAALLGTTPAVEAQYKADTPQFEEEMETAEAELTATLEGGDYVEDVFYPERQYEDLNTYVYAYPDSSEYTIGIIVDPCKGNDFDCCHRFYGAPEYPMEIEPDGSNFRAVDKFLFADSTEIISNTAVVDKDGVTVNAANSRFADDEIVIDDNCTAAGVPEGRSCVGYRQKMQRSTNVARCTDNNQTVDAASSCQNLTGSTSEHCVAVGYSQTAISVVCGGAYAEDAHCGTFLEMHMGYSNSYVDAEEVISEVRLTTENVTGYTTTTIPTTWMNESSQVLCAFEHASLMVGTMVLISEDAPVCCCPRAFSQKDHLGSLVCPVYDSLEGPFAPSLITVAEKIAFEENLQTYPFCPALEENEDLVVMSEYSSSWRRFFTRDALVVAWDNATSSYTSEDVAGAYEGACEYLPQCALATGTTCSGDDREYTFGGRVGKITYVPDDPEDEQYGVTFNDGRTSYYFNMEHLQVEQDYSYEIWWVQRTLYNFRVQSRKPLTVTSPTCTFDSTNGQYYPYTMLDEDGVAID